MASYKAKREYGELVAIGGRSEFHFVDEIFSYEDGLHGATGTAMVPVTRKKIDRRVEELKDYEWSAVAHIYDEQDPSVSWDEWIGDWSRRELEELAYDPSYEGTYGADVREYIGNNPEQFDIDESDVYAVECIGGGRSYASTPASGDTFDTVVNEPLFLLAKYAEHTPLHELLE